MTDQREQQQQQPQSQPPPQQQQQQLQQHQTKGNEEPRTNLIINYLPQNMNEKDLYSLFVTIGPVESCRVMKDYKTGYSYGFGFVNYAKAEDAATAISTLNGLQVQNKRLKVSFARPSGEEIKETNLYVTNLPRNITESQIDEIFSKYGNIVQKNILKDKLTGLPRGVAFVRFDKREEAQEAIAQLHGTIPEGGSEPLSVKIAEEHGKQKAAYYAGWQAGYNQSRGGSGIGVGGGRVRGIGGSTRHGGRWRRRRWRRRRRRSGDAGSSGRIWTARRRTSRQWFPRRGRWRRRSRSHADGEDTSTSVQSYWHGRRRR
ncbi:Sex-lethal-like protein [Ooceraea biroi]|uniref:Sex-lethal-like protein n=1 Tax=Ooceraea biroi TaxID=2015173 RepID=A0A026WTV9_OOCBI|nr:Sex-lethal-like protein [Ooceraea biroi]